MEKQHCFSVQSNEKLGDSQNLKISKSQNLKISKSQKILKNFKVKISTLELKSPKSCHGMVIINLMNHILLKITLNLLKPILHLECVKDMNMC